MKIILREEPAVASASWDRFLLTAHNTTFYGLSLWTEAVAALTGQQIVRLVAVNGAGEILAGVILLLKQRLRVRIAVKPWATPYCGIAYNPRLGHRQRLAVNRALAQHLAASFDHVRIETATAFSDVLGFSLRGWTVSVKSTYHIRRGKNPLIERVEPAVRRQIKKALRSDVQTRRSTDAAPLYRMYKQCYSLQGVGLDFNGAAFERFAGSLLAGGRVSLWYAGAAGSEVAGMLVGSFRGVHHYALAAFDRGHSQHQGSTLLVHDFVDQQMAPGETFDFVGANAYTAGITTFKSKFDPCEVTYNVLEWQSLRFRRAIGPAWRLVRFGRRLVG